MNKYIKLFPFICLLYLIIIGCSEQKKFDECDYTVFAEDISLRGKCVSLNDSVFMRYPFRIRQHGEYLYILDLHGTKNFFHVYHKSVNTQVAQYGVRGEGPEELLQAMNFRYLSPDSIWMLDSNKRQLCRWKFSPTDGLFAWEETIQLTPELLSPLDFVPYDSATFLIPDYSGKHRLHRVDSSGEIIENISVIPTREPIKESMQSALAQAWRSFIDYHPQKRVLVTATQLGDVVEIFNLNTGMHKVLYGPYGEPKFRRTMKGHAVSTGVMGYSDVQITDNYIYTVFHGRRFNEIARNSIPTEDGGRYIHVFDFEGNPVRRYTLDRAVYGIHIDEDTGVIWATDVNEDDQIVRFMMEEG